MVLREEALEHFEQALLEMRGRPIPKRLAPTILGQLEGVKNPGEIKASAFRAAAREARKQVKEWTAWSKTAMRIHPGLHGVIGKAETTGDALLEFARWCERRARKELKG